MAQTQPSNPTPAVPVHGSAAEETVAGCLAGGPAEFELTDAEGSVYSLQGLPSDLRKHVGEEITIRGTTHGDKETSLSFTITSVSEVHKAPDPKLSVSIADPSNWHAQTNKEYGVTFSVPSFPADTQGSEGGADTNFVAEQGAITLGSLAIPREVYPDTNFVGGSFLLSVNPQITNRESCEKFGRSDARFLSYRTLGGTRYAEFTEGDVATGTDYDLYYFHALQHGVCYEMAVQLAGYNTGNQALGCRVPVVGEKQELDLIQAFARRVSYFRPAKAAPEPTPHGSLPRMTSFTASSGIADTATNRGTVKFSWTAENADYVEFSYRCSTVGPGVVILEGAGRTCENDPAPIARDPRQFNRSPNSSTEVTFGNFRQDDPISIAVTITPFAFGKAYLPASRSLTITVDPYNPFPEGIHAATANMTLSYPGVSNDSYKQGASLTIKWTDTLDRDPCVNLYLVHDVDGRQDYISQIVHQCLRPAASGSYVWSIPVKYSGSGFRIYAKAPGGISSALGAPFRITPD